MFKKIKEKCFNFISFKEKNKIVPLTKLSILMLIILDLFVYSSLNMGIDFQTKVVNNPNTKYSYQCRDYINNIDKDSNNYLSLKNINNYIYNENNNINYNTYNKYNSYNEIINLELDNRCQIINDKINKIKISGIVNEFKNDNKLTNDLLLNLNKEISYLEQNYNTILIEKIANQNIEDSIINGKVDTLNIKNKYNEFVEKRKELNSNIENNRIKFEKNENLIDLIKYIEENKQIISDYDKEMKYYYIKVSLISILFSLPLVILFYILMKRHNEKGNYSKYMINKNLMIVSSIPLVSNIISIIYNVIPHTLIKKLIGIFYSINIPFIVYYILIGIFVIVMTFIIIKIQNRKEKETTKINFIEFYNKGVCSNCKNRVNYIEMNNCPYCNNKIKEKCKNIDCDGFKINGLDYCYKCGEK